MSKVTERTEEPAEAYLEVRPAGSRRRTWIAIGVVLVAAAVGSVGYILWAQDRVDREASQPIEAGATLSVEGLLAQADPDAEFEPDSTFLYANRQPGQGYRRLAVGDGVTSRALSEFECDRVHMSAGLGICLEDEGGLFGAGATILFDENLQEIRRFSRWGLASRARISPDGSKVAYTNFVTGHSYAEPGEFSTETRILDIESGTDVELESFQAFRNGENFSNIDFNYWGVTFTDDGNEFYATLGTLDDHFLVKGDVDALRVDVVTENAECPSLSPDGNTIVFKERRNAAGLVHWSLVAYDVETGERTPLPETRSIDDQVEWLDDDTIAYGIATGGSTSQPRWDIWALDIDGESEPYLLVSDADSPSRYVPA